MTFQLKIVTHHLIFDGWSADILIKEMIHAYKAILNNQKIQLPILPIQYKDYVNWSNSLLLNDNMERERSYWLNLFQDEIPVLNLQTDRPRPIQKTFNASQIRYTIEAEIFDELTKINHELGSTVFTILLANVQVLLSKYTQDTKIVLGIDVAGRNHQKIEHIIGMFVNTLALPLSIEENDCFEDIVKRIQGIVIEAYEHQNYPFDQLVNDLHIKRDHSRSPLFDVMVSLDNNLDQIASENKFRINEYLIENSKAHFDLVFIFAESSNGIDGIISYNTDLFNKETIELMQLRFQALLKNMLDSPDKKVKEINFLTEIEKEKDIEYIVSVEFDF